MTVVFPSPSVIVMIGVVSRRSSIGVFPGEIEKMAGVDLANSNNHSFLFCRWFPSVFWSDCPVDAWLRREKQMRKNVGAEVRKGKLVKVKVGEN